MQPEHVTLQRENSFLDVIYIIINTLRAVSMFVSTYLLPIFFVALDGVKAFFYAPDPLGGWSNLTTIPSLKLTNRTWKLMVPIQAYPFGFRPIFRRYVC